jgi:hypothetical protein
MRITEGRLDEFRAAVERGVAFVAEHWGLSDQCIAEVMEHCSVESLGMYGEPEEDVVGDVAFLSDT